VFLDKQRDVSTAAPIRRNRFQLMTFTPTRPPAQKCDHAAQASLRPVGDGRHFRSPPMMGG